MRIPRLALAVRLWGMRKGIVVNVVAADHARLEAVVANRNSPQKHVWRDCGLFCPYAVS